MKRLGLFGLALVVGIFGACNDNGGGSGFGLPSDQQGEVRMIIGTASSCVGGTNDGLDCSPFSDCENAFCVQICIPRINTDFRTPCTSDAQCEGTCAFACDRSVDAGLLCSQDTDCPAGTCTSGPIQNFTGNFNYPVALPDGGFGDHFSEPFSTDTDGDGDGFTPAQLLDTAPLGVTATIEVDFADMPDCVRVTWGPQQLEVFSQCGDPIDASFTIQE
jgi:hypothetical protein